MDVIKRTELPMHFTLRPFIKIIYINIVVAYCT